MPALKNSTPNPCCTPTSLRRRLQKVTTPSRLREMAYQATDSGKISARKACKLFSVSQTCYRYQPRNTPANTQIAVQLREIISLEHQKRWGFKLCFDHMRSVLGLKYNHKRVCRIYCQEKLNLRITRHQRIIRAAASPLAPPLQLMRCPQLTSCTTSWLMVVRCGCLT